MEQQLAKLPTGARAYVPPLEGTQNGAAPGSPIASGPQTPDDDPPRKRRLLFPKARPKKMQEFLGRNLNTFADSAQPSGLNASKLTAASSQPPVSVSDDFEAVICGGRSFEEILAAAGVLPDVPQPRDSFAEEGNGQQFAARRQKGTSMNADKGSLDNTGISNSLICHDPEARSVSRASEKETDPSGKSRATLASRSHSSASTSLLDSSCLGVQRLTLQSPSGSQADSTSVAMAFVGGKSPPEKRPSSGPCELADGDALHAMEALGDGGLGPLQKAADFSGIPLAVRLQGKVVKQRVHGCDEVIRRLGKCNTCEERVKLWDELVTPHLTGILKDTNALVGSKAVEMLLALVKGGDPAASAASQLPAAAALSLLQHSGKLIVSQLLSNPRHFPSCCELLLSLGQTSAECATETVSLIAAVNQQLLEEKKGNVAAIKGQGMRVVGSSMELLLQMLQAFGLQLVLALGGIKHLIQPFSSFASCSDKKVRTALSSLAATAVYLTRAATNEAAAAAAKKTVLECLKSSKSMSAEVEQLLEIFVTKPPPAPFRTIAGTGGLGGSDDQSQGAGDAGSKGGSLAEMLTGETDVLKDVCQQQTDWVLRVTEGRQSAERGDREGGEEPPWKVKLLAWQQLESALRDCGCLYKKNPFLQQQLLPLLHRVLTMEPTLPVVTCALKTLQVLAQLLLQPRGSEGSQSLQQQLRVLLPDVLAKLKVNNRPVQVAACACLGTYLYLLPIDVVVGDLLPMKEKLANFQKLLLDELTRAVSQQGSTAALHRAAGVLLAAAKAAAEDGNAAVRAAGVSLLASLAAHAEGSAAVGIAMQRLPEQKRQQLQKAIASSSIATTAGAPAPVSSPRRSLAPPATHGQEVPFSRMRSRGAAAAAATAAPATGAAERQGSNATAGQSKVVRKQGSGTVCAANGKGHQQRSGNSVTAAGVSVPSVSTLCPPGGVWEVPPVTVSVEEAEERTRELLPPELLQGLEAAAGIERRKAYNALEAWCRRPCECRLCNCDTKEGQMETEGNTCRLEACRRSAVHVLLHLRNKLRGFKERTTVLEEACMSCLQSIIGGLLLPADAFKAATASANTSVPPDASTSPGPVSSNGRLLPRVDKSIVGVVMDPLGDRLGDPRVGNDVQQVSLLLAQCLETPTTVAAQLALLAEGRVGGGRIMQGVCSLLEQLLQQWGLQAFTPPKQLLMIARQMLEPNKGTRSVAFPLLKRLHEELGEKVVTAMLVAHPLPDDVKHALKRHRHSQQQPQQQQLQMSEGSGCAWSAAAAALTAGAAAATAAVAAVTCRESPQQSTPSGVSVAQYITPELLQRLQHGQQEEPILTALQDLMNIFVNKAGDRIKPEGLSALVSLLRRRLGDNSAAVRRQVLLLLAAFCDRLNPGNPTEIDGASFLHSTARVYKQMVPAAAECLCDSDKKVMQAAHFATAKWLTAVGVADSLPLLQSFLSSSNSSGSTASSSSQRAFAGAVLRRPFSVGASGTVLQSKNVKLRDALFALMTVAMPVEPAMEATLLQVLVPHLLDALHSQQRADAAGGPSPASTLLSLVIHEGCQRENVAEMLQQRQAGQGTPAGASQSVDSVLSPFLLSTDTLKLLIQMRHDIKALHAVPLFHSSLPAISQTESSQQQEQDMCQEETLQTTRSSVLNSPTEVPCAGASTIPLSTRSQRIQRSNGAGFVTARRYQHSLRDELYNELKGRLESSLVLLMFPPSSAAPPASGSRQGVPQLSQLRAVYEAWREIFGVDGNISVSQQHVVLKYPLHGEQSITDIMLKWLAFCISEAQQQQRTVHAQEYLCVLLQMVQVLLQPYNSMRKTLPLYEQQQILQQLLDVASATVSATTATNTTAPRPIAKQLRQLVRETLFLLAAIAEDRPKFLSAVHRSLIRCKNKEMLVDLMAAMTRALGQHVQTQLQSKGSTASGNEALSDFLSQQCAARFFYLLTDSKASVEQRMLAFDFLVFCNLAVKGGALHLLPSLSPECRARLVEATKQITALGLPQSRLEGLIAHHCDGSSSAGEETTQPPTLEALPPSNDLSEAAAGSEAGGLSGTNRSGADTESHGGTSSSSSALRSTNQATKAVAPVDTPLSALMRAVAQADALLQMGGEELQQQASALEGWLSAARELRMQNKTSEAVFTSRLVSSMQKCRTNMQGIDALYGCPFVTGSGTARSSVEQLCCLTALKTWCTELQLRSLPRAAFGAHCLLFLLTSAPPNPNSTAATAATAAAAAAAQAAIEATSPAQAQQRCPQQIEQVSVRRSGRQHIQLTPVGEAVLRAHPLSLHFVLEGITKALAFFFEAQHYGTLHSAALSLQGAASALLLAEAVTRRRMQQYRGPGGSGNCEQKSAVSLPTRALPDGLKDGSLQPIPDKKFLQRCCSCLLLCMGRYQDHLYKSSIAMDSRLGSVRYLVTFLLNQVLGRNILQGDLRVLSCVAECCFTEAAHAIGSSYHDTQHRHTDTLWRLVSKVHKKAMPLLEKYAAVALKTTGEAPGTEPSEAEKQHRHLQALSILELINTVMTALSLLDGAYHTARLLIEQRRQPQGNLHQLPLAKKQEMEVTGNQCETPLAKLQRDRLVFLLHVKLFMHSFVSLCPTLLGLHLKATGITESVERSAWLERLLRSTNSGESGYNDMERAGTPLPSESCDFTPHVRGAEEACRGLRTFSCAAIATQTELASSNAQRILTCHRNALEEAHKWQAENDVMQVDSPCSSGDGVSTVVKTALKGRELALRALLLQAGVDPTKNKVSGLPCREDCPWASFTGDSIEEQPYDNSDDFTLHPLLQKIRQCLLSPSQQRAFLNCQSDALDGRAGCDVPRDLNSLHMLRFCAGTSAALPHHKLATLRTEAASSDCIPTDWLDLSSVAHLYKLDVHPPQSARRAPASNADTDATLRPEFAKPRQEMSCCGKTQQEYGEEDFQTSLKPGGRVSSALEKERMTSLSTAEDRACLSSKHILAGKDDPAIGGEDSSTKKPFRSGQQAPSHGSTGRSSSMRDLGESSGHLCDLPCTPVTISRLPQCGTTRLFEAAASSVSSYERVIRGGGVSTVKQSFLRRSSKPELSRSSLPPSSDA